MNKNSSIYLNELKEKWKLLESSSIFSYNLNIREHKLLSKHNLYAELNPERYTLRRAPQTILSLNPQFDETQFNFNKINPAEELMRIGYNDNNISFIINKSPLTPYHTLICPNLSSNYPQQLNLLVITFSVMLLLNAKDNYFRIGYNSPGALASVNHLHMHLLYIDKDLYMDNAALSPLAGNYIFQLTEDMPTKAICFIFFKADTDSDVQNKVSEIYEFTCWLCQQNLPHNLFLTLERTSDSNVALKVFIYVRENFSILKDMRKINVGFCELAGYIPIGDKNVYNNLSEMQIFSEINKETGNAFAKIYEYFKSKIYQK